MYVESLKAICGQQTTNQNASRHVILQEASVVASCTYESNTNWGTEVRSSTHINIILFSPLL